MSVTIPHSSGATCASCGRFVGPLEKCPYCGAQIQKRLPLSVLKLACLILAVVGVAILVYAVSGTATPTTKIGNVGATMNYAFVRIEGTVTRGPLYDAEEKTLRFYVADETGEIQATAFRDTAKELINAQKIPSIGDKISLDGTLRVRDDFSSLNVAAADKLTLAPPTAPAFVSVSDIGRDDEMRYVRIAGDIRAVREPYAGLKLVTLGDKTGEIDVAISGDIERLNRVVQGLELGNEVEAEGVVTYFRDEPQLTLRTSDDFVSSLGTNTGRSIRYINELQSATRGQRVRVQGKIDRISDFSQGKRVSVSDETGEITIVLWQDVVDAIDAALLQIGSGMNVVGALSQYRGELEIIPQNASDISFLVLERTPTFIVGMLGAPPTWTPDLNATPTRTVTPRVTRTQTAVPLMRTIGSITTSDQGKFATLTANITRVNSFSQGTRITLDDGTGSIILLLWDDQLAKYPAWKALIEGAQIRVIGEIEVFDGTLEILPNIGKDIEVLKRPVVTPLSARLISSISTNDLDKTVLLKGEASEVADFSAGKYVTLQDESGTLRVVLFNDVWEKVKEKVSVGVQMQVRGKVNVFAGKFELVAEEVTFP